MQPLPPSGEHHVKARLKWLRRYQVRSLIAITSWFKPAQALENRWHI
jgi:hypothetical protein